MENILKSFPSPEILMQQQIPDGPVPEVNGHIHTPYSFSAFAGVAPIFEMAVKEKINILGINDFYTTGGYPEFYRHAVANRVFPLFNIEFIALDREKQEQGIRVNDPNNPGRTYLSGKGLDFPPRLDPPHQHLVDQVMGESLVQVRTMVEKTNQLLESTGTGIHLAFVEIKANYARELVRERHIAKALRIAVWEKFDSVEGRLNCLRTLYGKEPAANPESHSAVENEIRNNLLKAGGAAFVAEDEKAFLSVEAVTGIIRNAGGIPCYPVLLDDPKGNLTDFEADPDALHRDLSGRGIFCIELIPGRNDARILEEFVLFFRSKGYLILLGTEHNTPDLIPLTISCRHQAPLTETLRGISHEGACLIAAHQYLRARNTESPVAHWNDLEENEKQKMILLGKAVVHHFITH